MKFREFINEKKFRYKKDNKAIKIYNYMMSWEDWYYTEVSRKELIKDLMKEFKITNKKAEYILNIWSDWNENKINIPEFQDFIHMVLQGESY